MFNGKHFGRLWFALEHISKPPARTRLGEQIPGEDAQVSQRRRAGRHVEQASAEDKAPNQGSQPQCRGVLRCALALSMAIQLVLLLADVKFPSTDIFVFKEAGVNFALTGRFTAKNLPHMVPEREQLFAYYPPAYPFTFGLWSKVLGVGLVQSNAFDLVWRLLRTVLLFLVCVGSLPVAGRWGTRIVVLLFLSSFISTDADRPDEMAFCLGLASTYLFLRGRPLLSALLLGLSASTSPAGGVFSGLLLVTSSWAHNGLTFRMLSRHLVHGVLSVGCFFACTLPILFLDSQAYVRFSKQVPMSTFPYLEQVMAGGRWSTVPGLFWTYLQPWFAVPLPYVIAAVGGIVAAAVLVLTAEKGERRRFLVAFFLAGVFYTGLVVLVWTRQPYYLWFVTLSMLGAVVGLLGHSRQPSVFSHVAFSILVLALTPLLLREVKSVWNAVQRPTEESALAIRERVLERVAPRERLAVTPDQYFTFRGYREIANIRYMCDRLDAFNYVYVTRLISAKHGAGPIPIPCESPLLRCFEPVANLSSNRAISVLGKDTEYYVRGAGGTLYANRKCVGSAIQSSTALR